MGLARQVCSLNPKPQSLHAVVDFQLPSGLAVQPVNKKGAPLNLSRAPGESKMHINPTTASTIGTPEGIACFPNSAPRIKSQMRSVYSNLQSRLGFSSGLHIVTCFTRALCVGRTGSVGPDSTIVSHMYMQCCTIAFDTKCVPA